MSTLTTVGVYTILRDRLLGFTPAGAGATLAATLGTRLYAVQAPDTVTYPYGVMRCLTRRTQGDDAGMREVGVLELHLYGRPRSAQAMIEGLADLCDQALWKFKSAADAGFVFVGDRQRDTAPPFPAPADRDLVLVRSLYDLVIWLKYLEQYAAVAP